MAFRVLWMLAAFAVLYGCGQASSPAEKQEKKQSVEEAQPEERKEQAAPEPTTVGPLEYGDPVELIGIPWSEPQRINYEGRLVVVVIFQFAEGPGAETGDRFVGVASGYGSQAAKELRAAGVAAKQAEPPECRLQGTYEGWVKMDDGTKYEALMVESAELEDKST